MKLDPDELLEKSWRAMYGFLEFIKPLLLKYDVNEVILEITGSIARKDPKCPRHYDKFLL